MNQIQQPEIKQEENVNNQAVPVDETSTYERQKKRSTSYYYSHKEDVIKKQKEYQKKQGSYKNSRNRLLRFLNSSPEYENTMKESTKEKYKFQKVNGVWE
jgi:nucleosome binding factor SPN SPT16 subunit